MRPRRVRTTAALLIVGVALSACTSSGDGASGPGPTAATTTTPGPPPVGVLVPAGAITLGSADADVEAVFEDGAFRFTSALDERSLEFTSDEGTLLSPSGVPLRCGNLARGPEEEPLKDVTEVTGPTSRLVVQDADRAEVAITAVHPGAAEVNPRALTGIPSAELLSSVFVTPEMAQQLADQPADEPLTIEQWELELDAGITVEADLSGSLARELSYRFQFTGAAEQGVSTNLLGIPCNERAITSRATPTGQYQLVLLVGGATLHVDGEAQTDTVADPAMQGVWAVAKVTPRDRAVQVQVIGPDGEELDHWTLEYETSDTN